MVHSSATERARWQDEEMETQAAEEEESQASVSAGTSRQTALSRSELARLYRTSEQQELGSEARMGRQEKGEEGQDGERQREGRKRERERGEQEEEEKEHEHDDVRVARDEAASATRTAELQKELESLSRSDPSHRARRLELLVEADRVERERLTRVLCASQLHTSYCGGRGSGAPATVGSMELRSTQDTGAVVI